MSLELYCRVIAEHEQREPGYLEELAKKLGDTVRRCPKCSSPMMVYSVRWRMGYTEFICPHHGLVCLDLVPGTRSGVHLWVDPYEEIET